MITEAQKRAKAKYEKGIYKKILLRLRTDGKGIITYEEIAEAAEKSGLTLNSFILEAVKEKIQKLSE